jgi:hypothetical protein
VTPVPRAVTYEFRPLQWTGPAVWAAWDNGAGAGSPAHMAAITAAITAVNVKLAAGP